VPPIPTIAVMSSAVPFWNGNESPIAWSSDQLPGPSAPSAIATTEIVTTYSQPAGLLLMKKPFLRWAVTAATSSNAARPP